MSKSKPKDKKPDIGSALEKQLQSQKRQLIQSHFTIKKLEEKLALRVSENDELNKQLQQMRQLYEEKVRVMNQKIDDAQSNNDIQIQKITDLQLEASRYQTRIKSLKEELSIQKQLRSKQVETLKIRMEAQKKKSQMELKQWQGFAELRQSNQIQINDLRQKLQSQKADKIRELADKEREKVQATDKLRDDMLKQIRQMHTKYVSLKKEQLDTTTRLTILQNHQLTSELEYQSKQTEKLVFKEQDMHQQLKQLTQQLSIHKQVQEQLAKRAHFSKGVIKKLTDRVSELESQIQRLKYQKNDKNIINSKINTSYNVLSQPSKPLIQNFDEGQNKEIISELEKQLAKTEKKYAEVFSKLEAMTKEKDSSTKRVKKYQNCMNELIKAMIVFSEQLMTKNNTTLEHQQEEVQVVQPAFRLDLEHLRGQDANSWTNEEITMIVRILLNLVRPYLTRKNLMVPNIKRLLILEENSDHIKTENSQRRLPKLLSENGVKGLKDLPVNISSKIVASNLRQWGNTVRRTDSLKKKYKITQSHR